MTSMGGPKRPSRDERPSRPTIAAQVNDSLHSCMVLQYLDRGSQIDEDLSMLAFHRQLSYKAGKLLQWEDQSDRAVTSDQAVLQYLDRGSQIDEDLSTLVLHRQQANDFDGRTKATEPCRNRR